MSAVGRPGVVAGSDTEYVVHDAGGGNEGLLQDFPLQGLASGRSPAEITSLQMKVVFVKEEKKTTSGNIFM